jgi:hypothetical protein
MGGSYSTRGRDQKCAQNFCWKNLDGIDHAEDVDVYGRIISELILGK